MRILIICLGFSIIVGCAGRDPIIQPITRKSDTDKTCEALEYEAHGLAATARTKISLNRSRDDVDLGIGIGGAIFLWPALFAMDLNNADGHEGNNLIDRLEYLKMIATNKDCEVNGWPIVVRYQ